MHMVLGYGALLRRKPTLNVAAPALVTAALILTGILPAQHTEFRLRITEKDGTAPDPHALSFYLDDRDHFGTGMRLAPVARRTDGVVELRLDSKYSVVHPTLTVIERKEGLVRRMVRVAAGGADQPGLHDLGTAVLSEAPLIASGIVWDRGADKPMRGIEVVWLEKGQPGREDQWANVYALRTRSAADGTWELRGPTARNSVRITCHRSGFKLETGIVAVPGTTGVRLLMVGKHAIEGSVILPGSVTGEFLIVALRSRKDGRRQGAYLSVHAAPGPQRPRFSFKVVPGLYDLDVSIAGTNQAMLTIKGVRCPMDDGVRARIDAIDLRKKLRVWNIAVVDHLGQPVRKGRIIIGGPPGRSRDAPVVDGEAMVVSDRAKLDLQVWTEHGGWAELADAAHGKPGLVLALQPRPRLRVRLSDADARIWRYVTLDLYLTGDSTRPGWVGPHGHASLTAGETVETNVSAPSTFRTRLLLSGTDTTGKPWSVRLKMKPAQLVVPAEGVTKTVEIFIDEPEREKQMKEMAGK
ncbi:MAG: hypothetical protein CMJ83_07855 [Planctomycetes bacterium]|nr:hypothetical protein [Planctomycetota bacterium]